MMQVFVFTAAVAASAIFGVVTIPAQDTTRPRLYTNQTYIEDVMRPATLPLADPMAILAFVLESLPERVTIYPTENYYYFYFYDGGTRYAGNIRLDKADRDEGKLHFAYYADLTEWKLADLNDDDTITYRLFGKADGVTVEKLEPLLYRVSFRGTSVDFALNDLSGVTPPTTVLAPDDRYLGPIFDEAAIRFFLIYNGRLKGFHYILDETEPVADDLIPSSYTDRILISRRTGFAFYRDHHFDRKILIGVFEPNIRVNNYYDGPFDQLPDNFIEENQLRDAILEIEPGLAGKIDRLGGSPDGTSRYLIGPYLEYLSDQELEMFHTCATNAAVPREEYHACFITRQLDSEAKPSDLPYLDKQKR